MMGRMRAAGMLVVWLLPAGTVKNRLLRMLGHDVHATAVVRPNLVWRVRAFEVGPRARVDRGNIFKNLNLVHVGTEASVGRWNSFSTHPSFARLLPSGAQLSLAPRSYITSRHQVDCSGSLHLGELAALAGHQTKVMTHSIDLARNAQTARAVTIGARTFVGARCLLLGGASLPDRSVLAAGSVLTPRANSGESGLWAGVPAVYKRPVDGAWFDRSERGTSDVYIPETGRTESAGITRDARGVRRTT